MSPTHTRGGLISVAACALPVALAMSAVGAKPAIAQTDSHSYDLTSATPYADTDGSNVTLTPNGGTVGPGGYAFDPDQGPTLSGGLGSLDTYDITFTVTLKDTTGYQKLIDFHDRSNAGLYGDSGLYDHNGDLIFYGATNSTVSGVFTAGQSVDIGLARVGATQGLTFSVSGVPVLQSRDASNYGVFATNDIHFFQDDAYTTGTESGPGVVRSITVSSPAPEPSQAAAMSLGVLGLALLGLKARRRSA